VQTKVGQCHLWLLSCQLAHLYNSLYSLVIIVIQLIAFSRVLLVTCSVRWFVGFLVYLPLPCVGLVELLIFQGYDGTLASFWPLSF